MVKRWVEYIGEYSCQVNGKEVERDVERREEKMIGYIYSEKRRRDGGTRERIHKRKCL